MKLIALCGAAGAGKDTVADMLPARKLAFADALYREVAEAFGVTVAELKCRETKELRHERLAMMYCKDVGFMEHVGANFWNAPRTGHASETTGDEFAPDRVLVNDGSLEDLKREALSAWAAY